MTFCFSVIMAPQHGCQEVEHGQEAGTHQFMGGGISPSIWRRGHLDLQWLPLQRAGSRLGVGSPLFCIPCGSAPPVHNGSKLEMQAPVGWGHLWELQWGHGVCLFLSLVISQLLYTDMASCTDWSNDFSPSATDWFSTNIWGWLS
jgi:hypothetical protein